MVTFLEKILFNDSLKKYDMMIVMVMVMVDRMNRVHMAILNESFWSKLLTVLVEQTHTRDLNK